jgi:hypothetical protein
VPPTCLTKDGAPHPKASANPAVMKPSVGDIAPSPNPPPPFRKRSGSLQDTARRVADSWSRPVRVNAEP